MENLCIESDEIEIQLAGESDGTEDPLAKENVMDTAANGDPSMRQVCSWISDGTAGNMSVEEIEIEEIKIESTDDYDPSLQSPSESQIESEKKEGNSQPISISETASHNRHQYRRLRCNFCSLLFYSEKTLSNHEKKCQLVSEEINEARASAVQVREAKGILEDLQKRLPQFTVAITGNEDVGTSSRAGDGTAVPQSHHRKSGFTVPIDISVTIVPKLEAPPTPPISMQITDPLKLGTTLVQETSNSIHTASIPPSNSSTAPCSSSSVFTTSGVESQDQEIDAAVPLQTAPIDIAVKLERIENTLALLRKENCLLRETLAMSQDLPMVQTHNDSNIFDFERLSTQNQLMEFEVKLGEDIDFADTMVSHLKWKTAHCNPGNRIVQSLDFLFSRQLFASCTWTGVSKSDPKIPFYKYENIRTLLRRVSGSSVVFVENILRSRLRNAGKRLRGIPGRRPFTKKTKNC